MALSLSMFDYISKITLLHFVFYLHLTQIVSLKFETNPSLLCLDLVFGWNFFNVCFQIVFVFCFSLSLAVLSVSDDGNNERCWRKNN